LNKELQQEFQIKFETVEEKSQKICDWIKSRFGDHDTA
jgi:hypothetical protein